MLRVAIFMAALTATAGAQTANLAVTNARIYTVDPAQPRASAIAVRGQEILAVSDDVSRFIGKTTQVIDAHGATLIPGFIDSHGHMRGLGEALTTLDLTGVPSEAVAVARTRAAARRFQPGEWITGRGWDQNRWPSHQFPTLLALSHRVAANPVVLSRVDGHAIWVNQKALDLAGITARTPDPPGGKILRDRDGVPSGVLLDNATRLVTNKIPPPSAARVEESLLRAVQECVRLGLTTVHDAGVEAADIDAYRALLRRGQLPLHVYAMIHGPGAYADAWLAKKPEVTDTLTIRAIKLVADGALGSRGAALLGPYSDDDSNRGLAILDRATIRGIAERAAKSGFQVATHAIGDAANRTALDAYSDALHGKNELRFRIEHAQVVSPADFARFAQLSLIASMQATHATSDMPWAETRLGAERVKGAYAWQTFLKLGVHLANGSDFPVESPNPLPGFYAAVTRQSREGAPAGGWFPAQRLSREEALRSWTLEGAYAAFEEKRKGSLTPGKLADFVLLSGDIMTEPVADILKTRVTMTVAGGKIVWRE